MWRYLAKDTIDMEIYNDRKNGGQNKTPKKTNKQEDIEEEDEEVEIDMIDEF